MNDHDLMNFELAMAIHTQEIHNRAKAENWQFYTYPMNFDLWVSNYSINNFQAFEDHETIATYSDWHKDVYGYRDRSVFYNATDQHALAVELADRMSRHYQWQREQEQREIQVARERRENRHKATRNNQLAEQLQALLS